MDTMLGKDFKKMVMGIPDDAEIDFSPLTFYRFKNRGENLIHMEMSEAIQKDWHPDPKNKGYEMLIMCRYKA